MSSYFKKKNSMSEAEEEDNDEFSLKNIKLNIGPAERLFGPGGVKFTASGYVEAKMGIKHTTDGNPTRSEAEVELLSTSMKIFNSMCRPLLEIK